MPVLAARAIPLPVALAIVSRVQKHPGKMKRQGICPTMALGTRVLRVMVLWVMRLIIIKADGALCTWQLWSPS
jgi:hypothetical protein